MTTPNQIPTGNPMSEIDADDKVIRFGYQDVGGTKLSNGLLVPVEIECMYEMRIDIMGMLETNRPWTTDTKHENDLLMRTQFRQSQTQYTSMPTQRDTTYQPGGNLLTINGRTAGRIAGRGSDALGRFCWLTLREKHDEGVIVITAYRVCHEKHDNPGPYTAFQQQYLALRSKGIVNPNPQRQVLEDIRTLVETARADGYRPIVMVDANGDIQPGKDHDKDLSLFVQNTGLDDPFFDRFQMSPPTTAFGSKRIDYIFVDPALSAAILQIGYLGSHEGAYTDHCLAFVDFDKHALFRGIINRPVARHSCKYLLSRTTRSAIFWMLQNLT